MARGEEKVNECYNIIFEILDKDEEFKEKNNRWMNTEEMYIECKKRIKGLREIEFQAALELENEE